MKRFLNWIILNVGLLVSVVAGVHYDVAGLQNIAFFLAWVGILSGIIVSFNNGALEACRKSGPSVPVWINTTFDVVVGGVMVWVGWWVTGIFWFIHILCQFFIYNKSLDKVT